MYKALLFHPEGDYVTDFRDRKTIQEVWNEVAEMGSRWIFYPIAFVATDKTIVDIADNYPDWWKGKRITTVQKYLQDQWKKRADEICNRMNDGWPLDGVYTD